VLPLVYHPNYSCEFPQNHRFVMSKFVRLFDYLTEQGYVDNNVYQPEKASIDDLTLVHDRHYLQSLEDQNFDPQVWRRVGLPWSQGLIDRTFTAPNGTLLAARLALSHGIACHLAGGTHHAHHDFGSGFCMINDLAFAAKTLLQNQEIKHALIFDCDVHQGDGTAAMLQHEPDLRTCSIHCEKNFPFRKSQSDCDVGLDVGLEDKAYLHVVEKTLIQELNRQLPDIVFYDAGVDIFEHDELGHLNISWQGVEARDELVIKTCLLRHIPVVTVIGGGYDKDHDRLAKRHATVIEQAALLYDQFSLQG
jgi:acetoin utilization deacetylase AcuC-like enzyme